MKIMSELQRNICEKWAIAINLMLYLGIMISTAATSILFQQQWTKMESKYPMFLKREDQWKSVAILKKNTI